MRSSLNNISKLEFPLIIAAHDAGAANHIAAWFGSSNMGGVYSFVDGPARSIFQRQCPWMQAAELEVVLPRCGTLISGTGWASSLEHDARKMAKQLGCRSIAVIDHWVNYRERFVRNGEEVLPDEVWVTDAYAKAIAEAEFPDLPVEQVPNCYLEGVVNAVRAFECNAEKSDQTHVLYVLEPIRQAWGNYPLPGEFQALDFFYANLEALQLDVAELSIRLRPHPSDAAGKYDEWISAQRQGDVCLDRSSSLEEALAWADVVVGCQTYAQIVALAAGKRVVSSIPPKAPGCVLPQTGIIKLAEIVR